jgi:hypothetical protein
MTVTINGTTGYTGPIGAIGDLSTTGNTTLGDAAGDTLTINGSTTTFTQGTANGVAYLNGSKNLTTGTALVFDGTNLGIGTSSPSEKLQVSGATNVRIKLTESGSGASSVMLQQSVNSYLLADNSWLFYTNSSERARIDTSGNLGLGVTPSSWGTLYGTKALQVSASSVLMGDINSTIVGTNYYYDSSFVSKYIKNNYAQQYVQDGSTGAHKWFNAASGTAGGTITFTQSMTLDTDGDLGIGTTSPDQKLHIATTASETGIHLTNNNASVYFAAAYGTGNYGSGVASGDAVIRSSTGITFTTNSGGSAAARIDSSGRLNFYGASSTSGVVNIPCQSSGTPGIVFDGGNNTSDSTAFYLNGGGLYGTCRFADVDIGGQGHGGSYFSWERGGSYDNNLNLYIRNGGNTSANRFQFVNDGNAYKSSGAGSWGALSDIRVKTNVTPVTGGLARVLQLNPVTFDYKSPSAHQDKEHDKGFIANEFMLVYPDSVSECNFVHDDDKQYFEEGEKAKGLSFNAEFYADLVASIQEQQAIITQLKARLDAANL